MASDMGYLRVKRMQLEDGKQEYVYTTTIGSFAETRANESREDLESCLEVAAQRINRPANREAGDESFADLGDVMGDRYVPEPVLNYLFGSKEPLLIETDDPEFPWELLRYQGQVLGIFRSVGRTIPQRRQHPPGLERWGTRRQALLIGDPSLSLPETGPEIEALKAWLEQYQDPYRVKVLPGGQATASKLRTVLQHGCEFFHFAGHALYDEEHHGASGLSCADEDTLTANDILDLNADFAFVFVNGCEGARAAQTDDPALRSLAVSGVVVNGLATAFLMSGASAFISALWPIWDPSAHEFARLFYEQARRGISFGEALRWVREKWRERYPNDPTWAAYVLYGNPLLTLDTVRDPHGVGQEAAESAEQAHDSVLLHDMPVVAAGRFRDARVERFVHRYIDDETLTLSVAAQSALQQTLQWVDRMNWHLIARLDLLVGLALVPGGMVERGLRLVGSSSKQVRVLDGLLFGQGKRRVELPDISVGVATALQRAARFAHAAGRREMSEDDLAAGLLNLPGGGSLHVAMMIIGCDPKTLLAAARGGVAVEHAAAHQRFSSQLLSDAEEADGKHDTIPRQLLLNLRAKVEEELRGFGVPPCVERLHELRELLRVLTRSNQPHAVIRGPAGVGVRTLAHYLAVKVVTDPASAEATALADWNIVAVTLGLATPTAVDRLRKELASELRDQVLLVLEDLPALLHLDGVPALVRDALQHPNLRCLATAHYDDYLLMQNDYPEIARVLTPIDLAPPRPEVAQRMVQANLPRLERKYGVRIAGDAVQAAVGLWEQEQSLALPGAAITRLERACAWLRTVGLQTNLEGEPDKLAAGDATRQTQIVDQGHAPTVTAADVRATPPWLME